LREQPPAVIAEGLHYRLLRGLLRLSLRLRLRCRLFFLCRYRPWNEKRRHSGSEN
jgi:hypothetical protein